MTIGRVGALAALTVALLVSVVAAASIGSVAVPLGDTVGVITRRLGFPVSAALLDDQIVWQLRLPRVVGSAAVGATLAVAGAVLQSLTRNQLADPYLLGVSSGASVGAVTVLVTGVGAGTAVAGVALTGSAFLGALVAIALVLALATTAAGALPPARTVLAGVAVAQAAGAYCALLILTVGDRDAPRQLLMWTLGSFAGIRWGSAIFLVVVAIVGLALCTACARDLDALAFGETSARALGVNLNRLRWLLLVGTALVTAAMVAYAGVIGFVGLVVPHMVRLLAGSAHATLLPLAAVTGALTLVWTDALCRSVIPDQEIPVGVITAAVGAPLFAWLLRRERR